MISLEAISKEYGGAFKKDYALRTGEIIEIADACNRLLYDSILTAFEYGFIKGVRCQKANERRQKKSSCEVAASKMQEENNKIQ